MNKITGSPVDRHEIHAAEVEEGNHRSNGTEKGEIASGKSANGDIT
jgi:hypothetical protein